MKKILIISSVITLLTVLGVPTVGLAALPSSPPECCYLERDIKINNITCNKNTYVGSDAPGTLCQNGSSPACQRPNWGIYCLLNAIYTVTDWIFYILMAIVAIMVIWGAFNIVTAGGDPSKVSTGRNFIVYAMVGFALALLSKAIPSIAQAVLGM